MHWSLSSSRRTTRPPQRIAAGVVWLAFAFLLAPAMPAAHAQDASAISRPTDDSDTPARKIYLALQLMYLSQDIGGHHETYFGLVQEFLGAAPSALAIVAEINNRILNGELYKALKAAKRLIAYEQELMAHAARGERLR